MVIYHEVAPDALARVKIDGLKRASRGEKGKDKLIIHTNEFLDKHCPPHLHAAGVSRHNNIYGYLGTKSSIIDIQDGSLIPLSEKGNQNNLVLLRLELNIQHCWVSDLDMYDKVRDVIAKKQPTEKILQLCRHYWNALQPLKTYKKNIRRPEVMITYDIPASCITPIE
jgi:hypothetical protein